MQASTGCSARCVKGENARIDSTSSPKNSMRSGSRPVVGKTSTSPPRTANCPRSSTRSDALVAGEGKLLGQRVDTVLAPRAQLDRRGTRSDGRQRLCDGERGRADEPAAREHVERARTLADEVRRRLEAGLPANAAARHRADELVAEEPGGGLGDVARIDVLGDEADERTLEALVERRQHDRQGGLGHPRTGGQRLREGGEALVVHELADECVEYRTVHDEGRNLAVPPFDRSPREALG